MIIKYNIFFIILINIIQIHNFNDYDNGNCKERQYIMITFKLKKKNDPQLDYIFVSLKRK